MPGRTDPFTRRVHDLQQTRALTASPQQNIREAIGRMRQENASAIVIVNDAGNSVGIFTEADVTHRIALVASGDESLAEVMTTPVETIAEGEYLYVAVARMQRRHRRHMPVITACGKLTGILNLRSALAECARETVAQFHDLTQSDSLEGLRARKHAQVRLGRGSWLRNTCRWIRFKRSSAR